MTEQLEFKTAELLKRIREDLKSVRRVAEIVSLNREAVARIVVDITPMKMDQKMALGAAKLIHDALTAYADDMEEAAVMVESGKVKAEVKIMSVDGQDVTGETKH